VTSSQIFEGLQPWSGSRGAARQVGLDRRTRHHLCSRGTDRALQRRHGDRCERICGRHYDANRRRCRVINAFQVKSWGKFPLDPFGLLYILAGFVTFENPLLAAALLTLALGAALVASGIMRIILAFT